MTSELRPAVEVVVDVLNAAERAQFTQRTKLQNAVGYVEADREAVRAEMRQALIATGEAAATHLKELAKYKALAETLAGALGEIAPHVNWLPHPHCLTVEQLIREAMRQYKEARDD